jgi:transcription elongation factor Elf1
MTTTTIPISFNCRVCGEKLVWPDDAVDSTKLSCKKCGKYFGTFADLRHTATEAVKKKAVSAIRDAFKRRS